MRVEQNPWKIINHVILNLNSLQVIKNSTTNVYTTQTFS